MSNQPTTTVPANHRMMNEIPQPNSWIPAGGVGPHGRREDRQVRSLILEMLLLPHGWRLLLRFHFPFHRLGNQGPEKSNGFTKVTQQAQDRARAGGQFSLAA